MFERIICVLVRIKLRGHLVMSIMQFMHLLIVSVGITPLVHARDKGPKVNRSLFDGTDYVISFVSIC